MHPIDAQIACSRPQLHRGVITHDAICPFACRARTVCQLVETAQLIDSLVCSIRRSVCRGPRRRLVCRLACRRYQRKQQVAAREGGTMCKHIHGAINVMTCRACAGCSLSAEKSRRELNRFLLGGMRMTGGACCMCNAQCHRKCTGQVCLGSYRS